MRKSLRKAAIFFLGIFCVLVLLVLIQFRALEFSRHEVPIQGLPPAFDGFTIVQISDTHVGVWTRAYQIRKIVRQVNALHPGLVVLTGDYVNHFKELCVPSGRSLEGIKAKYGVYAILGNHDYWVDADLMTRALRDSKIDVIFDEQRKIRIGRESITLVGLDDEWEGKPDYAKALKGITPKDTCIVIAHNPDAVPHLDDRQVDFLMCGHTHGGIIVLPRIGPIFSISKLGTKYSAGMFDLNGIKFYVSRGIGLTTGIPFRINCPPEVPVFVLVRK